MVGKVVKITNDASVLPCLLGSYGVVKAHFFADKWEVEFKARVQGIGSLSHTVRDRDFEVVGKIFE